MNSNILIFTASTGHGHNAAAESLKKEIAIHGYSVFTFEPIKEVSKSLDIIIGDGYKVLATKMPKMYGTLYKISNYEAMSNRISKIFIKALEEKIIELINEYKPSLIISTHPLIVNVISDVKYKESIRIPFISVITDYQAHQSYVNSNVDAYIAGSEYTKDSLIKKGINESKIYTYGIPINRKFHCKNEEHNKYDDFTLLLMGGSMGVSGIKKALKNLLDVQSKINIIVVCGKNESLKKSLENKFNKLETDKNIEILGFTDKVDYLMEMADVIITKPGGLTVTESLTKEIPMIIPYYIPGQEKENSDILVDAGVAISSDVKKLNNIVDSMIDNPNILKEMKHNIRSLTKTYSLDSTVYLAIQLIEEYETENGENIGYERQS